MSGAYDTVGASHELQMAIERGDWTTARQNLQMITRKVPDEPDLHYTLGSVLRNEFRTTGRKHFELLDAADSAYEGAQHLKPKHADAAAERASLAVEIARAGPGATPQRTPSAIAALHRKSVRLNPSSAMAYRRQGEWLSEWDMGRHEHVAEAAHAFRAAHTLEPSEPETTLQLALHLHKERRSCWIEAAALYERSLTFDPTNPEVYRLLGTLLHRREPSLIAAEEALGTALRLYRAREPGGAWVRKPYEPSRQQETVTELKMTLQLQGRLHEAAHLVASPTGAPPSAGQLASAAMMPWTLGNELELSMYLWRHRDGPWDSRMYIGKPRREGSRRAGEARGEATPGSMLLRECSGPPPDLAAALAGGVAAQVRRATVVQLWRRCKRAVNWPLLAPEWPPSVRPPEKADRPIPAYVGGGFRDDDSSALHLAARWGFGEEVEELVEAAPNATAPGCGAYGRPLSSSWSLGNTLRSAGPLQFTPLHEAMVHPDGPCETAGALLRSVGARSPPTLAALLNATDDFGRTPLELLRAVGPGENASACIDAAVTEAGLLLVAARPADAEVAAAAEELRSIEPPVQEAEFIEAALVEADTQAEAEAEAPRLAAAAAEAASGYEPPRVADGVCDADAGCEGGWLEPNAHGWLELRTQADLERRKGPKKGQGDFPRCDVEVWTISRSMGATALHGLGAKFIRDVVSTERPLLLRGLLHAAAFEGVRDGVSGHDAVFRRWSRPSLRRMAGNDSFQVMQYSESTSMLTDSHTWRRALLSEYLDQMRASPKPASDGTSSATRGAPIADKSDCALHPAGNPAWPASADPRGRKVKSAPKPELPSWAHPEYVFDQSGTGSTGALGRAMRGLFPWRSYLHAETAGIYVGGNGSGNPFHYHQQTWNALVAGRKRWFLFPPNASFYSELHPTVWLRKQQQRAAKAKREAMEASTDSVLAKAGKRKPKPKPKAAAEPPAITEALECEQQAGDVLFVPRLWGHGTINLGESVGIANPFTLRRGVRYGAAAGREYSGASQTVGGADRRRKKGANGKPRIAQ